MPSGSTLILQPHPHLEDGTAYRQVRPTKLDKIKNLHVEVQVGGVSGAGLALPSIYTAKPFLGAPHSCGAPRLRRAGVACGRESACALGQPGRPDAARVSIGPTPRGGRRSRSAAPD